MSYDSQVAALSPWGYWKTNESSGNLADSSGNSRTMVVTGSPTYAQTGPDTVSADAVSWTNVANQHAETTATTAAGVFTYVAWVNLASAPAANLAIMSRAIAYGTVGAADGRLFIDTAGKINFSVFSGSTILITAASALPTNTWVMITASVGAAGMRLRVNKTSVATGGATSAYTGASQLIFMRGGDSGYTGTAPVKISKGAYFVSQLANADTDALYDAGVPAPDATVVVPGATATAAGAVPVVAADAGVVVPAASASAAGLAPVVTTDADATVFAPAAAATAAGVAPTAVADSTVGVPAAAATADGLPPTAVATSSATVTVPVAMASAAAIAPFVSSGSPDATIEVPPAVAAASALVLVPSMGLGTDVSNVFTGRERGGTATVELTVPVVEPIGVATSRVDKAVPLPLPVLVKGRPT